MLGKGMVFLKLTQVSLEKVWVVEDLSEKDVQREFVNHIFLGLVSQIDIVALHQVVGKVIRNVLGRKQEYCHFFS